MTLRETIRLALQDALDDDATRRIAERAEVAERLSSMSAREIELYLGRLEERLVRTLAAAQIAVTGRHWIGGAFGSVDRALFDLIARAEHEILVAVYSFGAEATRVLDALEDRLAAGIRVGFVINVLEGQPAAIANRLRRVERLYPHAQVRSVSEPAMGSALHAKLLVADRTRALIGSANLSRAGLVTNHEMAVVLEGRAAEAIAERIDALMRAC